MPRIPGISSEQAIRAQVKSDNVNIVFSRNLIRDDELREFIEKIRVKQLISESRMTEDDALEMDTELKANWWGKNKEQILAKIK
ncbi:MAG: hypothetical protein NT166_24095 [Candidatus Aminicenantes bacterium]|nr:hypothetical protein [Candidatus Aminicenantes bacterium]